MLEACCDLVKPVKGHSPLLWTATSLSYIKFLHFTVSVSLTHTRTHTHMLLKETCDSDSDRVISHINVNRLKIPRGLSTLLFRQWSEGSLRGGVCGDAPYCFINT